MGASGNEGRRGADTARVLTGASCHSGPWWEAVTQRRPRCIHPPVRLRGLQTSWSPSTSLAAPPVGRGVGVQACDHTIFTTSVLLVPMQAHTSSQEIIANRSDLDEEARHVVVEVHVVLRMGGRPSTQIVSGTNAALSSNDWLRIRLKDPSTWSSQGAAAVVRGQGSAHLSSGHRVGGRGAWRQGRGGAGSLRQVGRGHIVLHTCTITSHRVLQ